MKAATGELNLTIVTVVAIGLLLTFFTVVFWPKIQEALNNAWDNQEASAYVEKVNVI